MSAADPYPKTTSERLLEVIRAKSEISRIGADFGLVMSLVAERAQALCAADGAVVELTQGEDMACQAATGIAASLRGQRQKRDGSLSGLCVRQGEPLRCDDSQADPRVDPEASRRIGLRSMIVVPLKSGDLIFGTLLVMARDPRAFDDDDLRMLGLMSDLITSAFAADATRGSARAH